MGELAMIMREMLKELKQKYVKRIVELNAA